MCMKIKKLKFYELVDLRTILHRIGPFISIYAEGENFSSKNFCPGSRTAAGGAPGDTARICAARSAAQIF